MHLSNVLAPLLAIVGLSLADFYIGNCAAGHIDNTDGIALPGATEDCNYVALQQDADICYAKDQINTPNNGGVCPGNRDDRSLSFCGVTLTGSGCPASFQMDIRDDCGDDSLKNNKLPDDGFFYANLLDTAKNNVQVGRCVYEKAKGQEMCPADSNQDADEKRVCATFIRCYTTMYGTTVC